MYRNIDEVEMIESEDDNEQTLDMPYENFGEVMVRAVLYGIVFLEVILIYGVRG
jgi:hypothetical protein